MRAAETFNCISERTLQREADWPYAHIRYRVSTAFAT